ncbi:MAG: enoyl-CoA hydratase/isomerase family protein [Allosphingosinicella sp.]
MNDIHTTPDEILLERRGGLAVATLNRPKALNTLTLGMYRKLDPELVAWGRDPSVRAVLIRGAGERAFCAGGDVRAIYEAGRGRTQGLTADFFREEYCLIERVYRFPKPYIALLTGITMGGGAGVSVHGSHRIATERFLFAMPETAIGLFPDVGGGWYLPRLPGRAGQFLALTGARLDGAECLALGLATHYVPSLALDDLKAQLLAEPDRIEALLDESKVTPPPARIEANLERIDRLFASDDFEEILAALEADGSNWARTELETLRGKSPQACKVSLRLLYDGARVQDFGHEMRQEYAVATRVVQRHDFVEGVRALLVDKDNRPRWEPPTPEGVTQHLIDTIFAPMPEDEEWTPL